jgi:hypothetical protein
MRSLAAPCTPAEEKQTDSVPHLTHRSSAAGLSDRPDTLLRPHNREALPRGDLAAISGTVLAYAGTIARFAVTQQARCGPGRIVENTIEYAASAGDAKTVAELLAKNDRDFLSSRQIGQLLRCGRWLPAELLHAMGVPRRQWSRSVPGWVCTRYSPAARPAGSSCVRCRR